MRRGQNGTSPPGDLRRLDYSGRSSARDQLAAIRPPAGGSPPRNEYDKCVTTALFPNSAVAIRKRALDQTFRPPNSAFYVEDTKVTAGHYD
jgi:hypothetical protein